MANESFIKVNNKLVLVNNHPITINDIDNGSSGGGAGYSVTFPAMATNWDKVSTDATLLLADGTTKPVVNYSSIGGQTIENVVGFNCKSTDNFYVLKMTLSKGTMAQCTPASQGLFYNVTTAPNTTTTPYGVGTATFWWPLTDITISAIEMYNTD